MEVAVVKTYCRVRTTSCTARLPGHSMRNCCHTQVARMRRSRRDINYCLQTIVCYDVRLGTQRREVELPLRLKWSSKVGMKVE